MKEDKLIKQPLFWLTLLTLAFIILDISIFHKSKSPGTGNQFKSLKQNDNFLYEYSYSLDTFIVRDVLVNGLICRELNHSWSNDFFIPFDDYNSTKPFKYLGKHIIPPNPLKGLKPMDMFHFLYAEEIKTFIVKDTVKEGLICTSTNWYWDINILIKFSDYNSNRAFKYLGKYKKP